MGTQYDPSSIELKWQNYWETNSTFEAKDIPGKPKFYALDMFPYPSGEGLHVGHPEGYTATDIMSRYKRMCGYAVLHPMGWDAFGLPTEQYAMKTGQPPALITQINIDRFRHQLKTLGFSYDWKREISTASPDYYRWTQWIFLQLFRRGLAYEAEIPVNWCPELGTVLANEEVIEGKSERGGFPVIRTPMRQWMLRITQYADRLLEDLDSLDWPENVKEMQRNWIGRSDGAEIRFEISGQPEKNFVVFTTCPDTLFGATYAVLAPEHPLVDLITIPAMRSTVLAYRDAASRRSDLDRTELNREKTGVFTGAYAINPATSQPIPVWIAEYVLAGYGTGAIMAVPGHDARDFEFAKKFGLPISEVIVGGDVTAAAYVDDGVHVNSGFLDGMRTVEARRAMIHWLETHECGRKRTTYRLRDWVFSRQRYWGEPIPLVHLEDGSILTVPENELPLLLPVLDNIKPSGTGESPLANATAWLQVADPSSGQSGRRETNTMPNWAGSCWYYLRFIDPHNTDRLVDPIKERYWMPVDLYIGGLEHAVLHLLYARFWHKVLYDLGLVSTKEPFTKLINQGMILGENGEKMSKSLGNVINPDHIVTEYGADSFRVYEMFMGPLEATKPWDTNGLDGVYRFLQRSWRLVDNYLERGAKNNSESDPLRKIRHQTIKKVTQDIESLRFNTAIAQMMVFVNELYREEQHRREDLETLMLLLAPFAPHLAEECWERLGHAPSIANAAWPEFVESYTLEQKATLGIQVNGKLRGQLEVPVDLEEDEVLRLAQEVENVKRHLEGKTLVKLIYVRAKLVSLVVK